MESNDSPEIQDRGQTADIPNLSLGVTPGTHIKSVQRYANNLHPTYMDVRCAQVCQQCASSTSGRINKSMQTLPTVHTWKVCKGMQWAVYRSGSWVCKDTHYYTHLEVRYVKVCRYCTHIVTKRYADIPLCTPGSRVCKGMQTLYRCRRKVCKGMQEHETMTLHTKYTWKYGMSSYEKIYRKR